MSYEANLDDMRRAYDAMAEEREGREVASWKEDVRSRFLSLLRAESCRTLLEIGAGTGAHGRFFADAGLDVVCTDLSPALVEACRAKGLVAHVRDFLALGFPDESFDAVFAMNCLLHVPPGDLPRVLDAVATVLRPGGLFYVGQYGGVDREGRFSDDTYEPKRYFSYLSDDRLREAVEERFEVVSIERIDVEGEPGTHFQSLVARRAGREGGAGLGR